MPARARTWAFPGLHLLLFLTVLSCLYDYATVRVGGGSATDLLRNYRIEGVRRFMAFVIPAGLAVLAVATSWPVVVEASSSKA